MTISGHITDASHRIHLAADSNGATCPASQHGGTKTNAALMDDSSRSMAYNSSYAALLNSATGYMPALTVQDNYVEISRLQIKAVPGNAAALDATGRAGVTLRRCLLEHRGGSWNTWFRYATGGLIESSLLVGLASNQFQGMEGLHSGTALSCAVRRRLCRRQQLRLTLLTRAPDAELRIICWWKRYGMVPNQWR